MKVGDPMDPSTVTAVCALLTLVIVITKAITEKEKK